MSTPKKKAAKKAPAKKKAPARQAKTENSDTSPNLGMEALEKLDEFQAALAAIPRSKKYLPQLTRISACATNNRGDILDEISRAHKRGRC